MQGVNAVDPWTHTLMPEILFLHLVLLHFLRCGEPMAYVGTLPSPARVPGGGGGGGGVSRWVVPIANRVIFPRFPLNLSPISRGDPLEPFLTV